MSSSVNVDIPSGKSLPITVGSDGSTFNTDVEIKLDPIDLKIEPLRADIKIEPLQVSTDSKVISDSKSEIDLKPVAMDTCTTLKFAPPPPVCVEQPYSQHFGVTFMGIELWGFNISGKSETFLHSLSKSRHHEIPKPCGDRDQKPNPPVSRPPSGLRVRVK